MNAVVVRRDGHVSLSLSEFLAEPRFYELLIRAPQEDNAQYKCEMIASDGSRFVGFGDNGYQALVAMITRFRNSDPDTGSITMTIDADRGHHRKD
jgi:hypothetical protein